MLETKYHEFCFFLNGGGVLTSRKQNTKMPMKIRSLTSVLMFSVFDKLIYSTLRVLSSSGMRCYSDKDVRFNRSEWTLLIPSNDLLRGTSSDGFRIVLRIQTPLFSLGFFSKTELHPNSSDGSEGKSISNNKRKDFYTAKYEEQTKLWSKRRDPQSRNILNFCSTTSQTDVHLLITQLPQHGSCSENNNTYIH